MRPNPSQPTDDPRLSKLPAPQPGVPVNVPIDLYPAYMLLHGYQPNGYNHPVLLITKGDFDAIQRDKRGLRV